jgi:glycosyltransferase involved in cell wall biosynthesis
MKILQTPVRFPPHTGGVENYVWNLSHELAKAGHEVTVICSDENGNKTDNEEITGITVKRIPYIGKIANTNITPTLPIELLKEDYDVIHTHIPTPWSADWSAVSALIKNKPLIVTYHNDITGKGAMKYVAEAYNNTLLRATLKKSSKIIATQSKNPETSLYLKKYQDKIEIIPTGVDIERFKPVETEECENTLFFLGVLDKYHEYKGLSCLLHAMSRVKKRIPGIKLIVGGTGELLEHYRKQTAAMDLSGSVSYAGHIAENQLTGYYNRCSAFVLPSTSAAQEGFGMVLLEAMACGKTVITTEITGIAERVRRTDSGTIVKQNDAESLSDAIITLMEDPQKTKAMGANARKLAMEYSWEKITRKVERIYEGTV